MENEELAPEAPAATTNPAPAPTPNPAPAEPEKALTDWQKEAQKWEGRSKENREKALRWDEYESKLKPEQEKTAAKLSEALKELEDLKLNILKNEVALEMNLPKEALSRLQGTTAEELKADAASLLSLFGGIVEVPTAQKPGVRPVPTAGSFADKSKPLSVSTHEEYLAALRSGL